MPMVKITPCCKFPFLQFMPASAFNSIFTILHNVFLLINELPICTTPRPDNDPGLPAAAPYEAKYGTGLQ